MLAVVVLVLAQPPAPPAFFNHGAQALTFYYKKPDPGIGPKLLAELIDPKTLDAPWTRGNPHAVDLTAAMLGDVARGKPEVVRQYEGLYAAATPPGKRVVLDALSRCGDADTAKWLAAQPAGPGLDETRKALARPERPRDRPATDPKQLDFLWADFFVSGEFAPAGRILDVFDRPESSSTLTRVARWSFGSNLRQHPKLRELTRANLDKRPEASRKVAEELLAETAKD